MDQWEKYLTPTGHGGGQVVVNPVFNGHPDKKDNPTGYSSGADTHPGFYGSLYLPEEDPSTPSPNGSTTGSMKQSSPGSAYRSSTQPLWNTPEKLLEEYISIQDESAGESEAHAQIRATASVVLTDEIYGQHAFDKVYAFRNIQSVQFDEAFLNIRLQGSEEKIRTDLTKYFEGTEHKLLNQTEIDSYIENYIDATRYSNMTRIPSKDKGETPGYIASEGPNMKTVGRFFEILVLNKCKTIVNMINTKDKCYKYPEASQIILPNGWTVNRSQPEILDQKGTLIKKYIYSVKDEAGNQPVWDSGEPVADITMFHYDSWPDHDVPINPQVLIDLREAVKSHESTLEGKKGPLAVNCRAGCGRTGTFIALDYAARCLENNKEMPTPGELTKWLRLYRTDMVQQACQFEYLQDAMKKMYENMLEKNPYDTKSSSGASSASFGGATQLSDGGTNTQGKNPQIQRGARGRGKATAPAGAATNSFGKLQLTQLPQQNLETYKDQEALAQYNFDQCLANALRMGNPSTINEPVPSKYEAAESSKKFSMAELKYALAEAQKLLSYAESASKGDFDALKEEIKTKGAELFNLNKRFIGAKTKVRALFPPVDSTSSGDEGINKKLQEARDAADLALKDVQACTKELETLSKILTDSASYPSLPP
ncbi:MAG: tyrosine-protein phosphatase [Parachlamydiaceae bacterium]